MWTSRDEVAFDKCIALKYLSNKQNSQHYQHSVPAVRTYSPVLTRTGEPKGNGKWKGRFHSAFAFAFAFASPFPPIK